jgi:hypothetical protein
MREPAGGSRALPPPVSRRVDDRPLQGQHPGALGEPGDPGDHRGDAEPVAVGGPLVRVVLVRVVLVRVVLVRVVLVRVVLQVDHERQPGGFAREVRGAGREVRRRRPAAAVGVSEHVRHHPEPRGRGGPRVGQVIGVEVVGTFRGLDRDEADAVRGEHPPVDGRPGMLIGRDVHPAHGHAGRLRDRRAGAGYRGERQCQRHATDHGSARNGHSVQLAHARNVINTVPRLKAQRRRYARLATSALFAAGRAPERRLTGMLRRSVTR